MVAQPLLLQLVIAKSTTQIFFLDNKRIELLVPENQGQLTHSYSPYWAKVWPAALGLCQFLQNNLSLIQNKSVLELAAGLGLPGIFSAHYTNTICISDIEPQAVAFMKQSVQLNKLSHVQCCVIDWDEISNIKIPEVLLLSDINYEPAIFDSLYKMLQYFLNNNCLIILSTPQRLMAKEFISRLLPWCVQQDEVLVKAVATTVISIFVLAPLGK